MARIESLQDSVARLDRACDDLWSNINVLKRTLHQITGALKIVQWMIGGGIATAVVVYMMERG